MNIRLRLRWGAVLRSRMQCLRSIATLGIFLALAQPQALAQRFFYRFTPIVDTEQGFPISDLQVTFPCQNSKNRVAFEAPFGNSEDIFTSLSLGAIESMADSTSMGYSGFGTSCSINAQGLVLFIAYQGNAPLLMLGGVGTQPQTLLSTVDGTYKWFSRFELNSQGKAVVLAERSDDSGYVVLTKAAGGSEHIVATTFPGSPYMSFASVSINSAGTVAFVATRPDGSSGIFTVSENGITQVVTDSNGPVAYFADIDLNDKGSVAFGGNTVDGTPGVWRADNSGSGYGPVITKIIDGNAVGALQFLGVSINNSGEVSSLFQDANMSYNVGFGTGGISLLNPIVVQPYMYVLGRLVVFGTVSQDSLNDAGQIALLIGFFDGSSVIALAQIVDTVQNPLPPVTEFGLSTGTGSSAGVHTFLNLPSQLVDLAFDATFITKQGELKVTLGDKVLKTIPASARGVRQSIRVPINMRQKGRRTAPPLPQELKFQVTGAPGTVVQIGNIRIPDINLNWSPNRKNSQWHFDTQGGGWGGLVDATRFPVEIKVLAQEPQRTSTPAHSTSVVILSTKSFDATKDIERDTLHFAGMPVRSERDARGKEHPQCAERDGNGDGHPDLVCEFEAPAASTEVSAQKRIRRLEGMTPYGWIVEGRVE